MALITINGTRTNVTATASDVAAVTNLDNLSDVNVENGLADNELLQYNYSASVWENTHEPVLATIAQTATGTTLKQTATGSSRLISNDSTDTLNSLTIEANGVNINSTTEILSGSSNRTKFKSGNDGGEILNFAFDSTGNDIYTGMHWRTAANKKIFRIEARAPGGVDPGDNSYYSNFVMSGSNNSLLSKAHNESFAPFSFLASVITMGTSNTPGSIVIEDDDVSVNNPLRVNTDGDQNTTSIELTTTMTSPDDLHNFYKSITDYGTASIIDHKHQFNFASQNDAGGEVAIGALRADYNSGDNNSMSIVARSHDYNNQYALKIDSERVTADVAFHNINLNADPTPAYNGMQYYNDATHKLRLYANGSWVDLN